MNEKISLWQRLSAETRPIVLYGMGNGADKILNMAKRYGIRICDVFASDGFVRGQTFAGYPVLCYDEICRKYADCIILLGFAVFQPKWLDRIGEIAERYELLAPDLPLFDAPEDFAEILPRYADEIAELRTVLSDETSQRVLENLLNYKMSGKIDLLRAVETPQDEIFTQIFAWSQDEAYADLGAYDGDTVAHFRALTQNRYARILALEPDPRNFRKLTHAAESWADERIALYPCAAWSEDTTRFFTGKGGRASRITSEGYPVAARSLDSILNGDRITYIKMDVEGAEWEALSGCRRSIAQYAPKLAVSAYHKSMDFVTLPLFLHRLNPEYRIFLRHHPYIPAWETNVYATR